MARNKNTFPVVMTQNQNTYSSAYGKFYAFPYSTKTLDLRGLLERVAFDQSVYTREIIEGVITRLTRVMVEQLQSAQPIRWDGLGTFTPSVENVNISAEDSPSGQPVSAPTYQELLNGDYDVNTLVRGIHIRFKPIGEKNEDLTSRALADLCTFELLGYGNSEDYVSPEVFNRNARTPKNSDGKIGYGSDSVDIGSAVTYATGSQLAFTGKALVAGTYSIVLVDPTTKAITQVVGSATAASDGASLSITGTPSSAGILAFATGSTTDTAKTLNVALVLE